MMKALLGDDGNGGYSNQESFNKTGYVFFRGKPWHCRGTWKFIPELGYVVINNHG